MKTDEEIIRAYHDNPENAPGKLSRAQKKTEKQAEQESMLKLAEQFMQDQEAATVPEPRKTAGMSDIDKAFLGVLVAETSKWILKKIEAS